MNYWFGKATFLEDKQPWPVCWNNAWYYLPTHPHQENQHQCTYTHTEHHHRDCTSTAARRNAAGQKNHPNSKWKTTPSWGSAGKDAGCPPSVQCARLNTNLPEHVNFLVTSRNEEDHLQATAVSQPANFEMTSSKPLPNNFNEHAKQSRGSKTSTEIVQRRKHRGEVPTNMVNACFEKRTRYDTAGTGRSSTRCSAQLLEK